MYAVSGNIAPSPAHDSTHTVWPAPARRRTTGGVRATLRSNGPRSRTTPIFIGAPRLVRLVTGSHRGVCVQQLHADGVQPLRHHRENGTHQGEPEGVVLLAGVAQARAIEGQGMHFFESAGLELLARVAGERRPSEDLARHQRGNPDWPAWRNYFQGHVPGNKQVEQAGMIAFLEDQFPRLKMNFAGHPGQPRDVVRPESLAERMLLQKVLHNLAIHSTSQKWWRKLPTIP